MASIPESAIYKQHLDRSLLQGARPAGWFRVGIVAAASAFAGGVAAAWYYRKTLAQLRQAENFPQNTNPALQTRDDDDF
jgi:hypothetical protein